MTCGEVKEVRRGEEVRGEMEEVLMILGEGERISKAVKDRFKGRID